MPGVDSNAPQPDGDQKEPPEEDSHDRSYTKDRKSNEKRQIGPRLSVELADDLEVIVRHLNNGKYKGRLSDEVANAIELYLGNVLQDHPEWIEDADSEAQQERFKKYAKSFEHACSSSPVDSGISNELEELRQEIQAVNATNTNMLSQILSQINEGEGNDHRDT